MVEGTFLLTGLFFVAFPCDGHFFIFTFLLMSKINFKLYTPFFLLMTGATRSLHSNIGILILKVIVYLG